MKISFALFLGIPAAVLANEESQDVWANHHPGEHPDHENQARRLLSPEGRRALSPDCAMITEPGEAYGHHGACSGWNDCGDAHTCALHACRDAGYSVLVSYGEEKKCTEFVMCHLFWSHNPFNSCSIQYDWGNWCDVMGVTDIVCSNFDEAYCVYDGFSEFTPEAGCGGGSINGDPHIQTWSGLKYDFHGVCDLVLLQNPNFDKGVGMDIHVRTKQIKQFSYVSSAVLKIGSDTLEVVGAENQFWINKEAYKIADNGIVGVINGYPISYEKINSNQFEFVVGLGDDMSIVMKTFKKFVRVNIQGATEENFGTSLGLLGAYGSGKMIARDNSTIMEDTNEFGQNWQVLPGEGMLFHNVEGPQAPAKCEIPVASNIRRRLKESKISEEEAAIACEGVDSDYFDMCVFDVMATGDKEISGAY